ncbi:pyridine nucleotide-disulfide oxidoreductase [Streptosporangium nondiastaticum]|uniref:Pyridine nucleotide-disulfide oxidoreductase n=1 Tax=Streptosporangium nondiastaticum TaxID=35764 RepID=A0A9X7JIP3_9ACTN|nr:FAD-dependent oxidoreductase [Streptosporangium nondiastaticum]PSJ24358.1 pyridine nucleotide-disulfide oxidoreductase [Streptosporangium nondiastaticum]
MTQTHRPDIVVLGAGYAGLSAALRLALNPHVAVTLIDPNDYFTERVRLHQLAAGRPEVSVTHPLSVLLRGTRIRHLAARAVDLDRAGRQLRTDDGRTVPYDRLVYALGSVTDTRAAQDAAERAYTAESSAELGKRLFDGPGRLAVVGGGLTGVELAAEIAESHPGWEVRLLTAGSLGAGLSGKGRTHVRKALGAMGVSVREGERVASVDDVDADVTVWSAALRPRTELAAAAGLELDAAGRIVVDRTLRSATDPAVYAAGDAAATSLRMACATAMPTGAHAAASVLADIGSRPAQPLAFRYVMQCISLGRHDGLVQPVHGDDSPRGSVLTGRPAAFVKEQVVRSTVRSLRVVASMARAR